MIVDSSRTDGKEPRNSGGSLSRNRSKIAEMSMVNSVLTEQEARKTSYFTSDSDRSEFTFGYRLIRQNFDFV